MPLILIVDADTEFATELASELTAEGYRTLRANCPPHALALLALGTPDAAVLDGGLADAPEADRLCATLRDREVRRLVVAPASGEQDGPAPLLRKPFGPQDVVSALFAPPAQAA